MKLKSWVNFKYLKAKKINLHRKLLNLVIKSEKIQKLLKILKNRNPDIAKKIS